jgi:hypothetical protein
MYGINYSKAISELHKAIVELNYNNKMDIHNLHRSSSIHRGKTKGIGYNDSKDKERLITIQNPERLNTEGNPISGWDIEYMGRDLSLEEDNYRWDVINLNSGVRGYYIVERELVQGDWLNVRWGKTPVNVKERKEIIDKKRLRDKGIIQRDMITAILKGK